MRLTVNGEDRELKADTLAAALLALDYEDATVATALNGEFVPKRAREATPARRGPDRDRGAPAGGLRLCRNREPWLLRISPSTA